MIKTNGSRWSIEEAQEWYSRTPWLCGFNYLPSTAVNSTEMWQHETFDPDTIKRELGWAQKLGLNCCRVFVQALVWDADPDGLAERLDRFLGIAHDHGIVTLPVLFDDCAFAGKEPYLGPQGGPLPGIHNSGWTPSPGPAKADDLDAWPHLREYVTALLSRFGEDERVLGWDLYNEPGNEGRGARSLPLLRAAFEWARGAAPAQPLTSGLWAWDDDRRAINDFLLAASDVLTFHEYADADHLRQTLARLQKADRPVICTEWMSRTLGSRFETHLPLFKEENVGCFFWGLVNGRTQTHFPWGSVEGAPPPPVWFHDLLDGRGRPYSEGETALIRQVIRAE